MKNKSLIISALFIFLSAGLFAQKGNMPQNKVNKGQKMFMNIPDLSDAQQTKLKEMRTAHMKKMMPLRNKVQEKQAHLQTLQTADNPDMNQIYVAIEEIGKIKTDMAKKRAAFRQEIRNVLTDDQRIYYDMQVGKMHKKMMSKRPPRQMMNKF